MRSLRRGALVVAACLGCGSELPSTPSDASDRPDTTLTDAPPFSFDVSNIVVPDAALVDVYVPLDDGGGLFQCDKDVCDGRTHYCDTSSIGPDLGPPRCVPLPDGCVPANCECLANANSGAGCSCEHATTGDGLMAGCSLP